MTGELEGLLVKGVITEVEHEEGEFISNVFLRPKPNGQFRLVLDLTRLNKKVEYEHFKMTSLFTAMLMLRPGAFMASVDLKDAYYSLGIQQEFKKLLRFQWEGRLYQFEAVPNGLACAPRFFTKILTPIYATLRKQGHECFFYIDDSFIIADTEEECRHSAELLATTLDSLGFVIHEKKSVLAPSQKLTFLGFELDSVDMVVRPTSDKIEKFDRVAREILELKEVSIREIAGLVGLMIAYAVALDFGAAHIKLLEIEKNVALKANKGNFDAMMTLSDKVKVDINWWVDHLPSGERIIDKGEPTVEVFTDASGEGWGAHKGTKTAGGRFINQELDDHINIKELVAILFGLQSLVRQKSKHIQIMTDNTTALAYVKNMGGVKSPSCNQIAKWIWDWAEEKGNWLSIAHIPGVDNVLADYKSRNFSDDLEWELNEKLFQRVCKTFGKPEVDLFASRVNRKLEKYVSLNYEPDSWKIDAFTFSWTNMYSYAFPPFSVVGHVLRKIQQDGASCILVTPDWLSQWWYTALTKASTRKIRFRPHKGNLVPHGKPRQHLTGIPLLVFRIN